MNLNGYVLHLMSYFWCRMHHLMKNVIWCQITHMTLKVRRNHSNSYSLIGNIMNNEYNYYKETLLTKKNKIKVSRCHFGMGKEIVKYVWFHSSLGVRNESLFLLVKSIRVFPRWIEIFLLSILSTMKIKFKGILKSRKVQDDYCKKDYVKILSPFKPSYMARK